MKYSQALLVACIGGAALVSALPATNGPAAAEVAPSVPVHGLTHSNQKMAESPELAPVGNQEALTGVSAEAAPSPAESAKPKKHRHRKHHHKSGKKHRKQRKQRKQHKQEEAVSSVHAAESTLPSENPTSEATTGALTTRELEQELEARFLGFGTLKQKYQEAKAERLRKEALKAQAKADAAGINAGFGYSSSDALPPPPSASSSFATRSLDDELEARLFDKLIQKYHEHKAQRLQNDADKAQAKAYEAAVNAGVIMPPTSPGVDSRGFEEFELDARDFTEEPLDARALSDIWHAAFHRESKAEKANRLQHEANLASNKAASAEAVAGIDARGISDAWHALFHKETKVEKAQRLEREAKLAAQKAAAAEVEAGITTTSPANVQRDLDEIYELAARYVDENELAARYVDEDELAARHTVFDTFNAIVHTFSPPSAKDASAPAPAPEGAAGEEQQAREYFDDFDLRDFVEIDELD